MFSLQQGVFTPREHVPSSALDLCHQVCSFEHNTSVNSCDIIYLMAVKLINIEQ